MRRWLRYWPRLAVHALPVLLAFMVASHSIEAPWVQKLDGFVYDLRLRAFMPKTLDDRIVIVDLDEPSLAEVGRWPWSRDHLTRLIERLFDEQDIAVLGMDVVFAEPDNSSGLQHLQALAQQELRDQPRFLTQLAQLEPRLDHDRRFADAIRDRPVVLGYYFTSDRQGHTAGQLPAPVFSDNDIQGRRFVVTEWNGYGSNLDRIAEAAPQAGFFNTVVDDDGIVRSIPLLARHGSSYYESLALGMFRTLMGMPNVLPGFPSANPDAPQLESVLLEQDGRSMAIPVDHQVAAWVPFRGPGGPQGGSFPYVSAADVLNGRLAPGQLQGKVVLLGTTAPGLMDLRSTPVGNAYPGVEAHANLLSGMLDGFMPFAPDYAQGYDMAQTLLGGLIIVLVLPWLNAVRSLLLCLGLLGLAVGLNFWFYTQQGLILPLASVAWMIALGYAAHMSYGYFVEGRSKRHLAELFGAYVPPALVKEMVKQPNRYSMQASERELTVMFSDMRGFTRLSESMAPAELQALLNRVFSQLAHDIAEEQGTIDKYMGDCVMAFWGAPIATPHHAAQAVRAALAMERSVTRINEDNLARGLPPIGMGVGLNTGPMCVGDMGSELRRAYTVIGDAVNLGSRLEGVSKFYGVNLVASGSTREAAGDSFVWQELDKVKVKGKNEAVSIYTCWGPTAELQAGHQAELQAWAQFLYAWRAQDWPAAHARIQALRAQCPATTLYALYEERVNQRLGQAFDPDWDGSTQFETK